MIKLFFQLLRRDFLILRKEFWANLINVLFWLAPNLIIFVYVLPGMGIDREYGIFALTGVIASQSLFTSISSIPDLLNDIADNHAIYYYLSLPLHQWLLFVRYALRFAMGSCLMSFSLLPLSKLVLGDIFDFSHFSLIKYLLIFILLQIFCGFFALLVTAYTNNMVEYERAWVRIVWPLVCLGGYQFPWQVLFANLPYLAYLNLLNPVTYCLEGFRVAVLGQAGYLNFWFCLVMLSLCTSMIGWWGIKKFMHRLDCIN